MTKHDELEEQFTAAVEDQDFKTAAEILISVSKFWDFFEENPPTWDVAFQLVKSLFDSHQDAIAPTLLKNMFGLDTRINETEIEADITSISHSKAFIEEYSVKNIDSVEADGNDFVVRATGSINSNDHADLDGHLTFRLDSDGFTLESFESTETLDD